MLVKEACKECKLTKKAVEYYTEQGLIRPEIMENGYRQFSETDVLKLKRIAVLRGLGFSVPEIRTILEPCKRRMKLSHSISSKIAGAFCGYTAADDEFSGSGSLHRPGTLPSFLFGALHNSVYSHCVLGFVWYNNFGQTAKEEIGNEGTDRLDSLSGLGDRPEEAIRLF